MSKKKMSTEDHLKPGEKTPYDRSKGVKRIHTPRGKMGDDELRLFPVIAFEFEKRSSILGDNAVFLTPEAAITLGEQLIVAGKGETPDE